jgi:serine/threonine protein kinase
LDTAKQTFSEFFKTQGLFGAWQILPMDPPRRIFRRVPNEAGVLVVQDFALEEMLNQNPGFGRPARHTRQFDFACVGHLGTLRKYRAVRFLGGGGEGEVYECQRFPDADTEDDEGHDFACFALKIYPSTFGSPPDLRKANDVLKAQQQAEDKGDIEATTNTVCLHCGHQGTLCGDIEATTNTDEHAIVVTTNPFSLDRAYLLMDRVPNGDFYSLFVEELAKDRLDSARLGSIRDRFTGHSGGGFEPGDPLFDEDHLKFIAKGFFRALRHLHEDARRVHKDLELDNWMLDRFGKVTLIDFDRSAGAGVAEQKEEEEEDDGDAMEVDDDDWYLQDLNFENVGGDVTGKTGVFQFFPPEYLEAVWAAEGYIEHHPYSKDPTELCSVHWPHGLPQSKKIDFRLSDVWAAGHILLRLLMGERIYLNFTSGYGREFDPQNRIVLSETHMRERMTAARAGAGAGGGAGAGAGAGGGGSDPFAEWLRSGCGHCVEGVNPEGAPIPDGNRGPTLSADGIDFFRHMLCPADIRGQASQLLEHPWLQGVPDQPTVNDEGSVIEADRAHPSFRQRLVQLHPDMNDSIFDPGNHNHSPEEFRDEYLSGGAPSSLVAGGGLLDADGVLVDPLVDMPARASIPPRTPQCPPMPAQTLEALPDTLEERTAANLAARLQRLLTENVSLRATREAQARGL